MKKMMILAALFIAILSYTACGEEIEEISPSAGTAQTAAVTNAADITASEDASVSETEAISDNAEKKANSESSGSKMLVAYFTPAENGENDAISSATLTNWNGEDMGGAEVIANMIQVHTGADLFSIRTVTDYPLEYNDLADFAKAEQDNGELPELTTHIDDPDAYDTIFVVFPAWWYTMPQAVYSFFEEYDFSGKTLIPVCTHAGSRLAGSPATFKELEPDAVVIENGFAVSAMEAANAEDDVIEWLAAIGY